MSRSLYKPDGEAVRRLRRRYRWTQEGLAAASELSLGIIRNSAFRRAAPASGTSPAACNQRGLLDSTGRQPYSERQFD